MDVDAISLITAGIAFYGNPLLEHVHSRVGGELNAGFDAFFNKVTQCFPWNKFKHDTLKETEESIKNELQLNAGFRQDLTKLAIDAGLNCSQILDVIRDYNDHNITVTNINNSGANIKKITNISQVYGDVNID